MKFLNFFLSEAIRPRATKFGMYLFPLGLCQVYSNYSLGVKFDPALEGVTSFTWAYIEKMSEIFLYLPTRPRATKFCMWLYLLGLYQEYPNCSLRVKIGTALGHKFYKPLYRESLRNFPVYLVIKSRGTKFAYSFI